MKHLFSLFWCVSFLGCACIASGAGAGTVWHIPENEEPGIPSTMRIPLYAFDPGGFVTIFQAVYKGFGDNQTGGEVIFRDVPRGGAPGAWQSEELQFFSNNGDNQFWSAAIDLSQFGETDVIQYYIKVEFDNSGNDPDTTFLHGGDLDGNHRKTTLETNARGTPCSLRNRPGWIFHGGNRVLNGTTAEFWTKLGYAGEDDQEATRWANRGALYFRTDGGTPSGSLGVGGIGTTAVPLAFDHPDFDLSPAGNAMWWKVTVAGLPEFTTIRYKIGFWHSDTNEEKFADHFAGINNEVFEFSIGNLGDPLFRVNGKSGNYTTTKIFLDEIAGDSVPLEVHFEPGESAVTQVEVFTNLNRRDLANLDANGDRIPDGVQPVDGNLITSAQTNHYYRAYPMIAQGGGLYTLTLPVEKTGAYRLTVRWKEAGDSNWRWYTDHTENRRDHAITVSPVDARDIRLYEINTLTIEASGDGFSQRSTLEDLYNASGAPHNATNRWDLDYLTALGANWLWFQPIHPVGIDGREPSGGFGTETPPYDPGSPYAVKNFFEVNPILTSSYNAFFTEFSNRLSAMSAFQGFVQAADAKGVGVMLDAPFNHTSFDVELGQAGLDLLKPDSQAWQNTDEIRNREARFFSRESDYCMRASSANDIALAPDRDDFGKWQDVKDVYFGRYAALVCPEGSGTGGFQSEDDWMDYTDPDWTSVDFNGGGWPRNVTRRVWEYFARYAIHWLDRTGYTASIDPLDPANRKLGIDGLRCDFGQGLPPQAWEYIINVARSRKWNFVMMSESLDGGAVTYRSNRHFDILNENIVFPLKSAESAGAYRALFEARRNAYGEGLVLLNTSSHDEENYDDPFRALIRYGVVGSMDGAPMIFPGQELGASKIFGYDHYELNFGKSIPHFKRFNSMMPAWNDSNFGNDQLFNVYSAVNSGREACPSLRSSNRWFLEGEGSNANIFAVARYEESGLSPADQDIVLAFVNLDRDSNQADQFIIPAQLMDCLGLSETAIYNVKNVAAYERPPSMTGRRDAWLWGGGITGRQLEEDGFSVFLNKVPTSDPEWDSAPYEVQYLKLFETGSILADDDGDGVSTGDEIIAGTDPLDANDYFRVVSIVDAGSGMEIIFTTVPGRGYTLQSSEDPGSGAWADEDDAGVIDAIAAGDSMMFTDGNPGGGGKFYRIVVGEGD